MWLNTVSFDERELADERLELGARDALYHLGPSLTLRRCTLVLNVPTKRLLVPGARLIDCTIEVKQRLKGLSWENAFLKGCRFTGALSGCDFGRWPDLPGVGGIEDCDFASAHLHGCRFIGCDAGTLRFPSWPCFTLLEPVRRLSELSALPWPGELHLLVKSLARNPDSLAAVTYSATDLAKEFEVSETDIRATLERLDGVKY